MVEPSFPYSTTKTTITHVEGPAFGISATPAQSTTTPPASPVVSIGPATASATPSPSAPPPASITPEDERLRAFTKATLLGASSIIAICALGYKPAIALTAIGTAIIFPTVGNRIRSGFKRAASAIMSRSAKPAADVEATTRPAPADSPSPVTIGPGKASTSTPFSKDKIHEIGAKSASLGTSILKMGFKAAAKTIISHPVRITLYGIAAAGIWMLSTKDSPAVQVMKDVLERKLGSPDDKTFITLSAPIIKDALEGKVVAVRPNEQGLIERVTRDPTGKLITKPLPRNISTITGTVVSVSVASWNDDKIVFIKTDNPQIGNACFLKKYVAATKADAPSRKPSPPARQTPPKPSHKL